MMTKYSVESFVHHQRKTCRPPAGIFVPADPQAAPYPGQPMHLSAVREPAGLAADQVVGQQ
jgi:hypothetical protein